MHKITAFAERNAKEILRDALSYIFCLGFPLVMLIIMTLVDKSIPKEAGMTVFRIENLAGGIAVFGQTFIMLFTAITVAKDRSGAFLVRMYATPMKSMDFALGYMLPMLCIALVQAALIGGCSLLVSVITGGSLSVAGVLLSLPVLLPSAVLFIGFGLLFGTVFNEKAAPGLCSIVISLGSFLGSIWFDAEAAGGVLLNISRCLPFHYCTKAARAAMQLHLSWDACLLPLLVVCLSAAVLVALACWAFRRKMKADLA
ncbi:MAG: ABC transporter permease [Clostridia bacterium]|nr:ABC transporter permease [Clostridia bacterium]